MSIYKIIASDLDGTLLNEDMALSAENARAITALAKKDVQFVPSSGRTLCEMPADVVQHSGVRYIIYSNGATIWDKHTDTHTYLCMSCAVSNAVLDVLKNYDCHILVRHGGQSYVDCRYADEKAFEQYQLCVAHRDVIRQYAVKKQDFLPFLYALDKVECYALFFSDDTAMADCATALSAVPDIAVVPSWPHCLEVFSKDAGKGAALIRLAALTDTPIQQTIAVGDSGNDASMVVTAGLGLATANACDALKQQADAVICANTEHIAQYILETYV